MAVISIVSKKELECGTRIDAEYYRPEYAKLEEILLASNPLPLKKLVKSIKSFGAYSLMNQVTYQEKGIPFLRAIDIKEGYADFSNVVRITKDAHKLLWKSEIKPRNVLLAMSGSVGNSCVASDKWKYPINSSQDLAKITVADIINPYLLSTFLNSKYGRFQTQRLPVGSIQQHVFLWQIGLIKVPLLTNIQEYIACLVQNSETKLQESENLYFQAEQILLSELGLHSWKPRHTLTYVRSFSQVAKASRMDAEHFQPKYKELREIIRNYSSGYLKLIDIAVNSNETIEPHANPEHDFEYIELADINQTIGVIENAKIINGKDAPSRARMLLRNGDVIASSVEGSLDKVALVSEEYDGAIGSTGFFVLRPRTVSSGYLLALIKSIIVREQMHCEASGTILSAVPAKSLKNIIVPNIPPEKQDEISALVQQSHTARREAKNLLEKAKRAVETAIEEGEERAMEYLNR